MRSNPGKGKGKTAKDNEGFPASGNKATVEAGKESAKSVPVTGCGKEQGTEHHVEQIDIDEREKDQNNQTNAPCKERIRSPLSTR